MWPQTASKSCYSAWKHPWLEQLGRKCQIVWHAALTVTPPLWWHVVLLPGFPITAAIAFKDMSSIIRPHLVSLPYSPVPQFAWDITKVAVFIWSEWSALVSLPWYHQHKPMKVLSRHLDSMNTADSGATDAVAPETTLKKIEGGKLFPEIENYNSVLLGNSSDYEAPLKLYLLFHFLLPYNDSGCVNRSVCTSLTE